MTKSVDIFTLAQQCWPSDRRMWSVDADLPRLARFAELVAIATAEAYTQAADQAAAAHKVERDELRKVLGLAEVALLAWDHHYPLKGFGKLARKAIREVMK